MVNVAVDQLTFHLLESTDSRCNSCCWQGSYASFSGVLQVIFKLVIRPTLCCRVRCCWSHCFMNRRSGSLELGYTASLDAQSNSSLQRILTRAVGTPCCSDSDSNSCKLRSQARTRPRSRNSAHRLTRRCVSCMLIVTDQHCQRQASFSALTSPAWTAVHPSSK